MTNTTMSEYLDFTWTFGTTCLQSFTESLQNSCQGELQLFCRPKMAQPAIAQIVIKFWLFTVRIYAIQLMQKNMESSIFPQAGRKKNSSLAHCKKATYRAVTFFNGYLCHTCCSEYFLYCIVTSLDKIPVKQRAANPLFCTELSETNSILRALPSEVSRGGSLDPQQVPCFFQSSSGEDRLRMSTLSYSHSC